MFINNRKYGAPLAWCGGVMWVACKWPVGNATVEIVYTAPWPHLITYHNVPLYNIIAIAVAPYAMWVRPYA